MIFSGCLRFRFGFSPIIIRYQKPHYYIAIVVMVRFFFPICIRLGFHFNVISHFSLFDIGWFCELDFVIFVAYNFCQFFSFEFTSNFRAPTEKNKNNNQKQKYQITNSQNIKLNVNIMNRNMAHVKQIKIAGVKAHVNFVN